MNKSEYQIVSIPDKFIIDKNAIYEFGIGLSNENALITDNEIKVQLVLKEQLDKYKNVIDKIKNKIKEDNEYLENAKEMYSEHDDELVKAATLQLINNNLVQNDDILELLEEINE